MSDIDRDQKKHLRCDALRGVEQGHVTRTVFRPHPDVVATGDVTRTVTSSVTTTVGTSLNGRKRWFVDGLARGQPLRGNDIVRQFGCTLRAARRDIAAFGQAGVVAFVGATKNGYYQTKEHTGP